VTVVGPKQRVLGQALFSDRSQIPIRMLTRGEALADRALWRARLESAVRFRASLQLDASAYRLVHGEADLLPSLVVDRYGDYLVIQTLSQGRRSPAARNHRVADRDPLACRYPGAQRPPRAHARGPRAARRGAARHRAGLVVVREGPIEYAVDLWKGQKTGLFLDQRENREGRGRVTRAAGWLDCFSYNGGFGLRLAPQCDTAEAIDISADAVARIDANAARNGNHAPARARGQRLRRAAAAREGARAVRHTIVLRPSGVREEQGVGRQRARRLQGDQPSPRCGCSSGRVLVTCSCSYNVDEALFAEMLQEAASTATRR